MPPKYPRLHTSNLGLICKTPFATEAGRATDLWGRILLSQAITVSGVPFSLVDLGAAWVYGFRIALGASDPRGADHRPEVQYLALALIQALEEGQICLSFLAVRGFASQRC